MADWTMSEISPRQAIFDQVNDERERQIAKFGPQADVPLVHPGHIGSATSMARYYQIPTEGYAKNMTDAAFRIGEGTYGDILTEEVAELISALSVGAKYDEAYTEAVQVAAVAVAIAERLSWMRK